MTEILEKKRDMDKKIIKSKIMCIEERSSNIETVSYCYNVNNRGTSLCCEFRTAYNCWNTINFKS